MKRTRGMGSVYQRGDTWWIQFYTRKLNRERGQVETVRCRERAGTKPQAVRLLKQRLGDVQRGAFVAAADQVTLADLQRLVLADMEANERASTDRAARAFSHLDRHLGMVRAIEIPQRASAYVATRRGEGAANATIRQELRALGRGFRLAVRDGLLAVLPVLPSVAVSNARQGFVTDAQLEALIGELPEHMRGPTAFAGLTGWRKSEVLSLEWRSIDREAETITLDAERSKNRRARTFPYGAMPELRALVAEQRARTTAWERDHGAIVPWVFWRAGRIDGKPVACRIADFRDSWHSATKQAEVPGLLFHDLRRSAVRRMEQAGVPRSVAMKLSGHLTESIYTRYAITSPSDLEAGVAKVARLRARRTA